MNLYEFEGKELFRRHGIRVPKGETLSRFHDALAQYKKLGSGDVVAKAQILSGKRGKNNGIRFCSTAEEVARAVSELFQTNVRGQYVSAVHLDERLAIAEEHYLSMTYDTNKRMPVLVYSPQGGMDIEDVPEDKITKIHLDIRNENVFAACCDAPQESGTVDADVRLKDIPYVQELWTCFLKEDCRLVEINPLVKTKEGHWIAADAKVAIDDDAFYRHKEWTSFAPRTELGRPPTEREIAVKKIDEGEGYYRGTAGKYIEMSGDVAILFSGGGASIANMDALIREGLQPANYTEYSGNPPREKVYELTKLVLSKPGIRGLWIAGGVANFTDIAATFQGIVDALDEIKPAYPIVVRRAGPNEDEGMRLMRECAERNGLTMRLFGKETSMSETAKVLAELVSLQAVSLKHV